MRTRREMRTNPDLVSTAYHEAGHAVVGVIKADRLHPRIINEYEEERICAKRFGDAEGALRCARAIQHLRRRLKEVSIVRNRRRGTTGHTSKQNRFFGLACEGLGDSLKQAMCEAEIAELLAGIEAQRIGAPESVEDFHWEADREKASHYLRNHLSLSGDPAAKPFRVRVARVRRLLRTPRVWRAVDAFALELLKRNTILGKEAEALIREALAE